MITDNLTPTEIILEMDSSYEELYKKMQVESFDSIRLPFDSLKVFPSCVNRFVELPSGEEYLVSYYLESNDIALEFYPFDHHAVINDERGTTVLSVAKSN